ncbi:transglycosylase domain-containing protein [Streptomyces sp. NPDC018031]|uniref:transglycosylase domain-containing protein n=1 Tax=Streptomyces sp. NPDC018031 TaxID=3365033 RepID=UPI0037A07262
MSDEPQQPEPRQPEDARDTTPGSPSGSTSASGSGSRSGPTWAPRSTGSGGDSDDGTAGAGRAPGEGTGKGAGRTAAGATGAAAPGDTQALEVTAVTPDSGDDRADRGGSTGRDRGTDPGADRARTPGDGPGRVSARTPGDGARNTGGAPGDGLRNTGGGPVDGLRNTSGAPSGAPGVGPRNTGGGPGPGATVSGSGTGAGFGALHNAAPNTANPSEGLDGAAPGNSGAKPKKKGRKQRPKRTGWRRLIPTWRMVLGSFLVIVLLIGGALVAGYMLVDIPKANPTAIAQTNVYTYSDGTPLARDGDINRENIRLNQVPKTAQHAVLAAEDRDFYSESAINPLAMIRAGWNTATGKGKQSGSTITQQYVKNYYLDQEQTVTRKVKEFFIAIKLDREVSKDEILEGYLNTSYFGRNSYGIQAAAQAYYGKDVGKIDTAEAAYLATLLNAPSAYDVVAHPENKAAAVARWNYVLDGMVKEGWLESAERDAMKFPTPGQVKPQSGMSGQRGYLVEAVEDYLTSNDIIDEQTLARGGYRITTTIDRKKQDAFVKAVDDNLLSKLSKDREVDKYVRAGGASVDPKTGKVVALYGGVDYTKQFVNNATRRDYQNGSTFKPFVFTAAVENGAATQSGQPITPNTIYDGTNKRPVTGWSGGSYAPENEDHYSYGPITVTEATDKSVNSVYAQMAVDVGPDKVKQTAVELGLPEKTPDLNPYPSVALGTSTASVLEMTEAYATLANHGRHGNYTLVTKITKDGEEIELPGRGEVKQVVSRTAADTTTSVLQSVVQGGTATAAQAAGRPAAGKTGTAEEDKAAWFAGYTPDLVTVVAVMGQNSETGEQKPLYGATGLPRINGGGAPAEIWAAYTKAALEGQPVAQFDLKTDGSVGTPSVPPAGSQPPGGTTPPSTEVPPTTTPPTTPVPPTEPTFEPPTVPPTQPTFEPPTVPPDGGTTGDPGGDPGGTTGDPGGDPGGAIGGPGEPQGGTD